jgi:hypothetical protein
MAPYSRDFLTQQPASGLWIAIGPRSWQFAKGKPFPVVVLPPGTSPDAFRWPENGRAATIVETGPADDELLKAVAAELIAAGAPFVAAIRESLLTDVNACVYFYTDSVTPSAA